MTSTNLGRGQSRTEVRHVGEPPNDALQLTFEVQAGGEWAVFLTLPFDRRGWKQLVDDLAKTPEAKETLRREMRMNTALSEMVDAVASWPDTDRNCQPPEAFIRYSGRDVVIQLQSGLLTFSFGTWMNVLKNAHAAWSDPGMPAWQEPIICKW
jgi:hypothetical protein